MHPEAEGVGGMPSTPRLIPFSQDTAAVPEFRGSWLFGALGLSDAGMKPWASLQRNRIPQTLDSACSFPRPIAETTPG